MSALLANTTVLITRPKLQAENLIQSCESLGATTIHEPVIIIHEIKPTPDFMRPLEQANWIIFTSKNAVDFSLPSIARLPAQARMACIGRKTGNRLVQAGVAVDLIPDQDYTSEGLLATFEMQQVANQNIVIVTGKDGRQLLSEELKQRGAAVHIAEVYERSAPIQPSKRVQAELQQGTIDAVLITSGEALQNFVSLYNDDRLQCPEMVYILPSERVRVLAKDLGISDKAIRVATSAHDEDMLQALLA